MARIKPPEFSAVERLRLFSDKVRVLEETPFGVGLLAGDGKIARRFRWRPPEGSVESDSLEHHVASSFLNTLRFFLQANEPTCLHRMKCFVSSLDVGAAPVESFLSNLHLFEEHLDGPVGFAFERDGEPVAATRRDVLEHFTYGEFCHSTQKPTVDLYRGNPLTWFIMVVEFEVVIAVCFAYLRRMAENTDLMLDDLQAQP